MKRKKYAAAALLAALTGVILSGCANTEKSISTNETEIQQEKALPVASEADKTKEEKVGYEGMKPLYADSLNDGEYNINVDSSSSMFHITECLLRVKDGNMSAVMTMSGTGYECLYMGSAEDACNSDDVIKFTEKDGVHSFTIPVEALDKEIECAAFSIKKQLWYDRKLVFRADSLPIEAFADGVTKNVDSLGLTDGEYMAEVRLSGGSGKACVESPTKITVRDGKAYAQIKWSSNKYDYMKVNDEKYLPISTEENSVFEIPIEAFDYNMPVLADTTAMSQPYEIEYTLIFDSSTIKQ
ncbi:MAG: hypothetical protein IJ583_08820 [Firmicutes bacterium]|nr:hypothetical protein [Bacillota bacterium]